MAKSKAKLISEIFEITGAAADKYFDRLNDRSVEYLEKYLKVIKSLG